MGFSVSGSAAIIFAAMFISFGMFHSAATNGFETVSDAQEDRTDRSLTRQNTAINVTSATWDTTKTELTVEVKNTGATELTVSHTDLLADNVYLSEYNTSVDGDPDTGLWLPGETLTFSLASLDEDPGQVKVVTGPGVATTERTRSI